MSEPETILFERFWPTPNVPAFATIDLKFWRDDDTELDWSFHAEITLGSGSMMGIGGTVKGDGREAALIKVYGKVIAKLGSVVADLVNERDDYKRLLEAEKAKAQPIGPGTDTRRGSRPV